MRSNGRFVIEDADGNIIMSGRDDLRATNTATVSPRFRTCRPRSLRASASGSYVIDEERVTGGPGGDVHAVAIYRLNSEGSIDRVRFLR
jgi:hypothetical protein